MHGLRLTPGVIGDLGQGGEESGEREEKKQGFGGMRHPCKRVPGFGGTGVSEGRGKEEKEESLRAV